MKQGPRLVCRLSSFAHPQSLIAETIASHPLNHALQLILPWTDAAHAAPFPPHAWLPTETCTYYEVTTNLGSLVEDLVSSDLFGQGPGLTVAGVGISDTLDATGGIAIMPSGALHLAVTPEAHTRLGLTGARSKLAEGQRYNVEVQLAGKRFKPSERRYEHVVAALKQRTQTTTLLLLLQQAGGIPLPMDLQSCRGSCQARQLSHTSTGPSTPVQVPLPSRAAVDAAGATPEASHALLTELFEWLGAASCSGSSSSGSDSSGAGGWPLPPPLSELPSQQAALQTHTWRGFLSSQQVRRCLEALRPLVSAGKLPWAALGVWGFADAPVAWLGREHGVQRAMSNESHYMLLLLPDDSYCVFIGLGPNEGETT